MTRCTKCGERKPVDGFYRDPFHASGHRSECKACTAAAHRARRAKGLLRESERLRYHANPKVRAKVATQTAKWKARNKEKLRAHAEVEKALRKGVLVRQPCGVCGEKAQAHHADYTKPLDVQWLCPFHHARQHVAEGRISRVPKGSVVASGVPA